MATTQGPVGQQGKGDLDLKVTEPFLDLLTDVVRRSDYEDEATYRSARNRWKDMAESLLQEQWPGCQKSLSGFYHLLKNGHDNLGNAEIPSLLKNIPKVTLFIADSEVESEEPLNVHSLREAIPDLDQRHFLLKFLRAGNHNPKDAVKCLKNYIKLAQNNPAYYKHIIDRDRLQRVLSHNLHFVLPKRDKFGRRVYVYRPGLWRMDQVSFQESYSCSLTLSELIALEARSQVAGCSIIMDGAGFGWRHFIGLSLTDMTISIQLVQQTFPMWFRHVHIINTSKFMHWLYDKLTFLMTQATRDSIIFHSDIKSLHQYIDPETLPLEFGGKSGPLDNTELALTIDRMHAYFQDLHRYIYQDHD